MTEVQYTILSFIVLIFFGGGFIANEFYIGVILCSVILGFWSYLPFFKKCPDEGIDSEPSDEVLRNARQLFIDDGRWEAILYLRMSTFISVFRAKLIVDTFAGK